MYKFGSNRMCDMMAMLSLAAVVSCGDSEVRDLDPENLEGSPEGTRLVVGDYANLTAREFENYKEDLRYLTALSRNEKQGRGYLNLADPQQYRFIMARLKINGKTADNSPQLFRELGQLKEEHARLGQVSGFMPKIGFRNAEDEAQEQHYISELGYDEGQGSGVANSTFPEVTMMTHLDVMPTDSYDGPIGPTTSVDEFGNGADVRIAASFDPDNSPTGQILINSTKIDVTMGGPIISFASAAMGPADPAQANRPTNPTIEFQAMNAPIDKDGDDVIQVCLNRTWPGDCDYDLTGVPQVVKLPLQGKVHITSPGHVFDANEIQAIKDDANNHLRAGHLKLNLTQIGGGCDASGELASSMQHFWNHTSLESQTTLAWDLGSDANSAHFANGCRQVQNVVFLNLALFLPWIETANPVNTNWLPVSVTSFDQGAGTPGVYVIPDPIQMTNSCLAAGTMIQMADGSLRPVEDLASGDRVFNTFHDGAKGLTVTATALGFEPVPMVRLESDRGHSAFMTEMHPVMTPDRGIVFARDLEEGDLVMTEGGVSVLTKAAREDYDGQVYNLKLGTDLEKAALGAEDRTLLYADGFLVGDGQIQGKYESKHLAEKMSGDVLDRLPVEWHQDYLMSPIRAK